MIHCVLYIRKISLKIKDYSSIFHQKIKKKKNFHETE